MLSLVCFLVCPMCPVCFLVCFLVRPVSSGMAALHTALTAVALHSALTLVWQLHHALVDRWGLLEKSFEQGDKNHDGCLSVAEFCTALRQVNLAVRMIAVCCYCALLPLYTTAVYCCCLLPLCTAAVYHCCCVQLLFAFI